VRVEDADISRVAELANLGLTPAERERMRKDLNSILDYIDRLNELDTAGVEPMAQLAPRAQAADDIQQGRDDVVEGLRPCFSREQALRNAPESDGTFFEVPKVIER
jgi:aspartyl-tRNA(Asn)/glutamyl-tRNA(Gln) amidotransferase subunit C